MSARVRAARGATTLDHDAPDQIEARVTELVTELLGANAVGPEDVISLFFTASPDIHTGFPATPARAVLPDVPLMGAQELGVEGAMPLCIRVMMHFETERDRHQVRHVYLHRAAALQATGGRAPT